MDENTIVEVLKSGLNLASTSISAIVGAVITTLFLRATFLSSVSNLFRFVQISDHFSASVLKQE